MSEDRKSHIPLQFLALAAGLVALLWAYWGTFIALADAWEKKSENSHGYLVPLIALALLWFRHEQLKMGSPKMSRAGIGLFAFGLVGLFSLSHFGASEWGVLFAAFALIGAGVCLVPEAFEPGRFQPSWWGVPMLVGGVVMRLFSTHFYFEWFEQLSLIPCIAGIVLLTVGLPALRFSWPAVLFLGFMVPLPYTLEGMLRSPLRKVGTKASTFLMQTCGLPAFADGNQYEVMVGGMSHRIGVTEACSGLSMLMIFFALSTATALIIRRPLWDRIAILLSAVPIALIANVVRITVTGMMLYWLEGEDVYLGVGGWALVDMTGSKFASSFFHDWAGWMMMPLALGLMWCELAILKRIVLVEEEVPLSLGQRNAGLARSGKASTPKNTSNAQSAKLSNDSSSELLHGAKS